MSAPIGIGARRFLAEPDVHSSRRKLEKVLFQNLVLSLSVPMLCRKMDVDKSLNFQIQCADLHNTNLTSASDWNNDQAALHKTCERDR
jgi:hypothetical protein